MSSEIRHKMIPWFEFTVSEPIFINCSGGGNSLYLGVYVHWPSVINMVHTNGITLL